MCCGIKVLNIYYLFYFAYTHLLRLSYKLCHNKKMHNFVTTQKNYEQQYGF